MSILCRYGWHKWRYYGGLNNRMGQRVCQRCDRTELQMGDGPLWRKW